jgi:hypothetical protein
MTPVAFDVPVEVAFDYLVDPRNRPLWQSSLRRVEAVTPPEPAVGQTWTDVTSPGLRPAMQTTELERPRTWTEVGTWRHVRARLTLHFAATSTGCLVSHVVGVSATGALRALVPAIARAADLAVPADLRRAARILSERTAEH